MNQQPNSSTSQAWLRALILRDPARWSSRLGALMSWMKMIGRGRRRRFGRAAAGLLAGASGIALMAMLAGPMAPPVQAAAITVGNSGCTSLIDAIKAANDGTTVNSCTGSGGADTITLAKDVTYSAAYSSGNALPFITSDITIRADSGTRTITLDNSSNSFRVVDVSGATARLTLENINMSGGKTEAGYGAQIYVGDGASLSISGGTFSGAYAGAGGSIFAKNSTVSISGSTISNNSAIFKGGGISVDSSTLTITDSQINDNTLGIFTFSQGRYGGGIFATNSDVTITGSEVNSNQIVVVPDGNGGGIAIFSNTTLTVTGSTISGNDNSLITADAAGGVFMKESQATFDNSTVSENVTRRRGGGIYGLYSTLAVTNGSIISGNQTLGDNGTGPGMAMFNSAVTVSDSFLLNNKGTGGNVWGGGMLVSADSKGRGVAPVESLMVDNSVISGNVTDVGGGGIYATYLYDMRITNSTVSQNDGNQNGGGIYVSYIYGGVISNTIVQSNLAGSGYGGGVFLYYADVQIVDSLIADNESYYAGGGIGVYYGVTAVISGTTITGNRSTDTNGGGIGVYGYNNDITVINSTISNNSSNFYGGGIYTSGNGYDDDSLTVIHTTVTGNDTGDGGGGIYAGGGTVTIEASIVSGNTASSGYEVYQAGSSTVTANYSVLGDSAYDDATAFYGSITFGTGTIRATSDGDQPTALSDIIDPTLADNGGKGTLPGGANTKTHALADGSPALDIILGGSCAVDIDQRGEPRPSGDGCDAGAFEYQTDDVSGEAMTFISTWTGGTVSGLSFGAHDVLMWDSEAGEWTKWFAGADAGLEPLGKWKHNLNAIWISDTEDAEVIFSLTQDNRKVPGITGIVDGMDLLRWDGDALGLWFDGQDVGLNVKTQEKIDGLHVLSEAPEWSTFSGDDCDAYLLISTQGPGLVPMPIPGKPKNVLKFSGEDVLGFCATNLGTTTTGFWEMVLDGSVYKVLKNNIESLAANDDASVLYLTSQKQFRIHEAFGGHSMVFAFDMETERFSGPYVRVMDDLGIQPKVDALHVSGTLSLP